MGSGEEHTVPSTRIVEILQFGDQLFPQCEVMKESAVAVVLGVFLLLKVSPFLGDAAFQEVPHPTSVWSEHAFLSAGLRSSYAARRVFFCYEGCADGEGIGYGWRGNSGGQ